MVYILILLGIMPVAISGAYQKLDQPLLLSREATWPVPHTFSVVAECDVRTYGAIGDGKTDDTQAFRDAIQDCGAVSLGLPATRATTQNTPVSMGRVSAANGFFLLGALNLTSQIELYLSNATLLASDDPAHYPIVPALPSYGTCRDSGYPSSHKYLRHQAFLSGWNHSFVAITGAKGSAIDGQVSQNVDLETLFSSIGSLFMVSWRSSRVPSGG